MKNKIETLKKNLTNIDKKVFNSIKGQGQGIIDLKENTRCVNENDCTKDTNYHVCSNWNKC